MKTLRCMLFGLVVALSACQSSTPLVTPTADPAIATLKAQADQAAANKEVMHKFLELFSSGAWDDLDQVIATDCVLHYPGGVDVVGLDAMVAGWQEFFPKLTDLKVMTEAEVSEGDRLMEFLTFEATYEGEYMSQQVSGVSIKYNQVEMQRIEDGKIVEWWVENDRLWMAEQLGMELVSATPSPMSRFPTGRFIHENHKNWVFQFNPDGTWLYFYGNLEAPEVEGTYSVDGNLYTETSASDPACPFPASYTWSYDGQNLTFQLVGEDKCDPRKSAYDSQTYIKSAFPTGVFAAKDSDWVLTLDGDGNFTFSESGAVAASGTVSIQANELTWETDSYCDPTGAGKATYTWTFEDDVLMFRVKEEDKCVDRLSAIDNVAYHRRP